MTTLTTKTFKTTRAADGTNRWATEVASTGLVLAISKKVAGGYEATMTNQLTGGSRQFKGLREIGAWALENYRLDLLRRL